MSEDGEEDLSAFVALHGAALRASRVPALYWESLCRKLRGELITLMRTALDPAAGAVKRHFKEEWNVCALVHFFAACHGAVSQIRELIQLGANLTKISSRVHFEIMKVVSRVVVLQKIRKPIIWQDFGRRGTCIVAYLIYVGSRSRCYVRSRQECKQIPFSTSVEVFDAGDYFGIMQVEEVDEEEEGDEEMEEELKKKPNPGNEPCFKVIVTNESGLQASNPNSIFLIDHAWTYRVEHARQQLLHVPGLLHRMTNLMGIDFHGEIPDEGSIEQVLQEMWKYNQTYQISQGTAEEKVPVWYIMDEFGSRIQHSDQPSFATAPLFYMPQQIAYTVLWPLRDLETGDEVTRDYAYGETDRLIRKCVLLPWVANEVLDVNCSTPEPSDEHYQAILAENKEKLPIAINPPVYDKDKVFKVFTDIQQVLNNLTHSRFVFTDNEGEADILYNFSHFKDYRKLSEERPEVMLNQFPCENLLTVKDCLASISRRAGGPDGPRWLPRTFNLQTELPQFISYFQQRDRRGEDNHWICKPWNLARSLDTHITNSLNNIIRHRESSPKVVCKYIENPVLFHREDVGMVKFDIRYVVLLRSIKPLKLYIYDVFWLRFSNRAFSLDDLDDYEKHFTVMNYAPGVTLKQVHCEEFIPLFEKQYPEYPWTTVQANIFKAFAELFQVASAKPAPLGICDYPSSRAIYAVDLMLKWDTSRDGKKMMQPQILEVNFNPDCDRACKYHPTFFNDVFSTLFLDETDNCHVTCIV